MHGLKRIAMAVLIALAILLVIIFILENRQPTVLLFLGWSTVQMPIAAYVIFALLFGMLVGPLLAWLFGLRFRRGP
jgi:putative membrane protein